MSDTHFSCEDLSPEQLVKTVRLQAQTIQRLEKRIRELEDKLSKNPTERLDESYSLDAEEKRKKDDNDKSGKPDRKRKANSKKR